MSLACSVAISTVTTLPTRLLSQTPGTWFLQTIAARWPATVLAVLGKLIAQRLDDHCLLCCSLAQRQNDRYEGFFIQLSKLVVIKLRW